MSFVPSSSTFRLRLLTLALSALLALAGALLVPARAAEHEARSVAALLPVVAPGEPPSVGLSSSFPAVSDGDVLLWRRADGATLRVRPEGLWLRRADGSLERLAAPSLVERETVAEGAIVYSDLYPGVTETWTVTGDDVGHQVTLERWPSGGELLEGEALVVTWLAENSRLPGPWLPDASVPLGTDHTVIDDLTSSGEGELSLHGSQQQVGELTRLMTELRLDTPTVTGDAFPIVISPTAVEIAFRAADSAGLWAYKDCLSGEEDGGPRVMAFTAELPEDVLPPLPMALPAPCSPANGTFTNFPGNDDLSVGPVPLGFTFSLYGTPYTSAYVNNNGNLTFTSAFGAFTASGFPLSGVPMVAPFWADVDTRTGNTVKYKAIAPNTFVVTFENVGYYSTQLDKLNTFQVMISDGTNPAMGIGKNVCFCYDDMQWTTGSASGGVGGFGGTPATVGVNGGNGVDYVQIGRFGMAGAAYDGPFGATDGISYLDGRTECFRVDVAPLVCTPGSVTINGCGSATLSGVTVTDINGAAVNWNWTSSNANLSVSPASGSLPAGPTGPQALPTFAVTSSGAACTQAATLTLNVTDALGALSICTTMVSLSNDSTLPVVNCPANAVVQCDGAGNTAQLQTFLDSFSATDNCGTPTTMRTVAPGIVSGFLTYSNFSNLTGLQLNGSTATIHGCTPAPCDPISFGGQDVLRLTNGLSQGGSAFTTTPLSLAADASFSTFFSFQMTDNEGIGDSDGPGADGLVFAVQTVSNTAGGIGGGIGYQGILNSVGVEFDTFNNGGGDSNSPNHVGINVNGSVNSVALTPVTPRFNNGAVWNAWIDYNGGTDQLEVRVTTAAARPAAPTLSATLDLVAILGSTNAFVGFTSGTGAGANDHDIRSWVVNTSFNPVGCNGTGVQTVMFEATDACGNRSSCSRTFSIVDGVAPVLSGCPAAALTVSCPSQVPAAATVTATDTCDASVPVVFGGDVIAGNVPCNYTVTRTWTATDDCGNSSSCTQVVTVRDLIAPVLGGVPADATVECSAVPTPPVVTATDNCGGTPLVTFVASTLAPSTMVHWWKGDANTLDTVGAAHGTLQNGTTFAPGQVGSAFSLDGLNDYVRFGTAGSLSGPGDFSVDAWVRTSSPAGQVIINQRDSRIDGEYMLNVGTNHNGGTILPGRVYFMIHGNGFQWEFFSAGRVDDGRWHHVTAVRAGTEGRIYIDGVLDGTASGPVQALNPVIETFIGRDVRDNSRSFNGLIDEVEVFTRALSQAEIQALVAAGPAGKTVAGNCPNRYTVRRVWTATDSCGNSSSATQVLTVVDTTPPVITCPAPVTVQCATAVVGPSPGSVIATDNCMPPPAVIHVSDVTVNQTCANRFTVQRRYRATDACGNSAECVQLITVNDTTAPVITCPAPVTVQCAAAVPAATPGTVVATDNCLQSPTVTHVGDVTVNQTCANRFTVQRTYRATDACGNSADCVQLITVNDTTAPVITCPVPVTVQCAAAVPAATPGTVVATDNCAPPPTVTHVGDVTVNQTCANRFTVQRTYRATDACGNSADCVQLITVNDTTAPVITCPVPVTVQCAAAVPAATPGTVVATDNCAPPPTVTHVGDVTVNQTCANRFTVQRTYRATDACGNSTDCVQLITVNDTTAPVITCPATLTFQCAVDVPLPDTTLVTATDNCVPAPTVTHVGDVVVNQTCVDRFTVQRTYRATDACGNSADCVQSIVVNDTTAPAPAAALVPLAPAPPLSAASPAVPQSPRSACSAPTSGAFTVSCAATDNCDPAPALAAVLLVTNHDVPVAGGPCVLRVDRLDVACGELVEIRLIAPPCPAKPPKSPQQASEVQSDGVRVFTGESVVLEVTATDRCGNAATASADPTTPPPAPCDEPLLDGTCCPAIEAPAPPDCRGGACP